MLDENNGGNTQCVLYGYHQNVSARVINFGLIVENGAGDNRQWESGNWCICKIFKQPRNFGKLELLIYPLSWDLWPPGQIGFVLWPRPKSGANSVKPPIFKMVAWVSTSKMHIWYIYIYTGYIIIRFSPQEHVKKCLTSKPSHDSNPQQRPTTTTMGCYPATRQLELFCSATCADDKSGQLPKIRDHYCPELVHCWLFPLESDLKKTSAEAGNLPQGWKSKNVCSTIA